jgi:hypothetical protein
MQCGEEAAVNDRREGRLAEGRVASADNEEDEFRGGGGSLIDILGREMANLRIN